MSCSNGRFYNVIQLLLIVTTTVAVELSMMQQKNEANMRAKKCVDNLLFIHEPQRLQEMKNRFSDYVLIKIKS